MATRALHEVDMVQNPALGAVLLWRFSLGYQGAAFAGASFPLFFLVLPICFHRASLESALRTRRNSGLALFAARLGEVREDLFAIHTRALAFRQLSLDSLSIAVTTRFLTLDYRQALVRANTRRDPELPERIKPMWDAAERLGHWCGSLSLPQIAILLKVDF